jgi:hypothetical protein
MWRTFDQLPAALRASVRIAERCQFRMPLRRSSINLAAEARQPLGPALLFGLEPARGVGKQQLSDLVEQARPARFSQYRPRRTFRGCARARQGETADHL